MIHMIQELFGQTLIPLFFVITGGDIITNPSTASLSDSITSSTRTRFSVHTMGRDRASIQSERVLRLWVITLARVRCPDLLLVDLAGRITRSGREASARQGKGRAKCRRQRP